MQHTQRARPPCSQWDEWFETNCCFVLSVWTVRYAACATCAATMCTQSWDEWFEPHFCFVLSVGATSLLHNFHVILQMGGRQADQMMRGAGVGPSPGVSVLTTSPKVTCNFSWYRASWQLGFELICNCSSKSGTVLNISFRSFRSFPSQLRQRMEIPTPSEQDIQLLMGLGFDRDTVVRVLRSCGNNTEAAANRLLGH